MIKHFKRLIGQIFYYGLGDAATKVVNILILPLFTRYLSPADYGVASILIVSTTLIAGIADLGLSISTYRFYYKANERQKKQIVSTAQIFTILFSATLAMTAIIFSHPLSELLFRSPQYSYILILAFLNNPLRDLSVAQINRLRLENKAKICTTIKVTQVITDIILKIIFIIFLKRGLNGLFEGQLINSTIYAIIFFFYSIKTTGWGFSLQFFKKMLHFGLPFAFSPIFFGILSWADRFILARLTNLSEVGLYTLGYMVGMAVMLPVGAFTTAWPAFYMSVAKEPNVKKFFSLVLTYFTFIIGYFILLVIIFARDYFQFLTPNEFHNFFSN